MPSLSPEFKSRTDKFIVYFVFIDKDARESATPNLFIFHSLFRRVIYQWIEKIPILPKSKLEVSN